MPDREKYIEVLSKTAKAVKELNEDAPIKISLECIEDILELLKEQDAETGHWIYKKYDDMFMCSCCEKYSIRNDYPYCHWCGAKMEGGEVDGQGEGYQRVGRSH